MRDNFPSRDFLLLYGIGRVVLWLQENRTNGLHERANHPDVVVRDRGKRVLIVEVIRRPRNDTLDSTSRSEGLDGVDVDHFPGVGERGGTSQHQRQN